MTRTAAHNLFWNVLPECNVKLARGLDQLDKRRQVAAVFKFAGSVGFSDHPARFLAAAIVPDSNSAVIFYRSDHMAGAGMPPFVKKERSQSQI